MNLALAAGAFGIILPAELPDKTFISAIVLASKHPPVPVWIGTAGGLVVQAAIAVAAGRALALLPHRTVEAIVAGLFLAGAAYLLLVPERVAERRGVAATRRRERDLAEGEAGSPAGTGTEQEAPAPSPLRVALMAFGIITLAEFGDLTQVILANLTARTRDPWSVFAGASVAFLLISAVGVAAGRTLTRYVPLALVRRLSGVVLAGLGAWSLATAVGA